MTRNLFALFAVPLFVAGSALAQTEGPLVTSTPIPLTLTDWSSSLTFPQFNPSLGTLQSVEIDLSGGFQTQITVTNTSLSSSNGTAKTEVQMTVQDGGADLNVPEMDLLSPAYTYSLGAGDSVVSGELTQTGTDDETYTLPAVLTEFTGVGNFTLAASTFTQTDLSNTGGNTSASQVTSADLTGDVIYTYSVPEPASISMIGIGALGLLARRRRAVRI